MTPYIPYEEALERIRNQGVEASFGVAAGMIKTPDEAREVAGAPGTKVRVGSITKPESAGNEEPTYVNMGTYSANSVGLKNGGFPYYRDQGGLQEIVRILHEAGKTCVLSIVAFTPEELAELYAFAVESGVDEVEINMSCPNRWEQHTGTQEPVICFSDTSVTQMLDAVLQQSGTRLLLKSGTRLLLTWVKISLFTDYAQLEKVARRICSYRFVTGITSANTAPNGWAHIERNLLAIPRPAGIAGSDTFRALVLGNIEFLRQILPPEKKISGVGGIRSASHAIEHFMHGADEVQVGTAYKDRGPSVLHRIKEQFDAALAAIATMSQG